MPELLDLIATTLPLASAPAAGDYTVVVQGGVLKKQAPLLVVQGTVGASAVVIDCAAAGVLGSFLLNVSVASGCTLTIETSRNSGSSYQQTGSGWTTDVSVQYAKGAADVNYVTHIRLTRTVGSSTASSYTITNGYAAFTGAQNDMIGIVRQKAMVTAVVSGQNIKTVDPSNDRGWLLSWSAIDTGILEIQNQATNPWDYSRGHPFFLVERQGVGIVAVNAANGGTGTGAGVTISNPSGLELVQAGPPLCYKSSAANTWTVS